MAGIYMFEYSSQTNCIAVILCTPVHPSNDIHLMYYDPFFELSYKIRLTNYDYLHGIGFITLILEFLAIIFNFKVEKIHLQQLGYIISQLKYTFS